MMTTRVAHYYPFLIAFLVILIRPTFGLWRLSADNETILSPGNIFELGVFNGTSSLVGSECWYLGIWFKRFRTRIVWVANRDKPLSNSTAFLNISNSDLLLLNIYGGLVWKTNAAIQYPFSGESVVSELLDSGNLVVRYSNKSNPDGILWQSFDYPTDTQLPGMELGLGIKTCMATRYLTSWAGLGDPSSGYFTYEVDTSLETFLQSFIYKKDGPDPVSTRIEPSYAKIYRTTYNHIEVSCSLRKSINASYYAALRLSDDGVLSWWEWSPEVRQGKTLWVLPVDSCDSFNACGPNAHCLMNPLRACDCLQGFHKSDRKVKETGNVPNGCSRKSQLNCSVSYVFRQLRNMKLPRFDVETVVDMSIGFDQCKERCLKSCNCTAFAHMEMPNGGSGCVMWAGDLIDIRTYGNDRQLGQDLHLKLLPTDLGETKENNTIKKNIIIGLSAGAGGFLLLIFITLCFWKIRRKKIERTTALSLKTNIIGSSYEVS